MGLLGTCPRWYALGPSLGGVLIAGLGAGLFFSNVPLASWLCFSLPLPAIDRQGPRRSAGFDTMARCCLL